MPGVQRSALGRHRRWGIPLYYQVMRELKEQIVSGGFGPGSRLPSEIDLTRRFRASRVVIRQALRILEEQGLVVRMKGRGTFVTSVPLDPAGLVVIGDLNDLVTPAAESTVKVLEFRLMRATPDLAGVFAISEGTELFTIERLWSAAGLPLAVLIDCLPYHVGAQLSVTDVAREPLVGLIERRAGARVDWAAEMIQAVAADQRMAALLQVDMLAPLLKLTLTHYTGDGGAIDHAQAFYRADRYRHSGFLKRNGRGDSAFWCSCKDQAGGSGGCPLQGAAAAR
jgi:GntR family transcriptional regulator